MLIIVQVLLTVFVWRKGWKWRSLIPLGSAFLTGVFIGLSGVIFDPVTLLFLDVLAIIALILMLVYPPKPSQPTKQI